MRQLRHLAASVAITLSLAALPSCGTEDPEPLPLPPEGTENPEPEPEPEPEPVPPVTYEPEFVAGKMTITTSGPIESKEEYVDCTISLTHDNSEWNLTEATGGIRGRGNSTWLWYPKKPYRIKFDKKQPMLGLAKAKSWVLLAEYRDPTDLMNTFVFELGKLLGMPYTNNNRYVEVTLNGKELGLYHLTEQVQQNKNRIAVDELEGIVMQLDRDDGPELAPDETDNFWSEVYRMPVCVKNPDEPTPEVLATVKSKFGQLETAIKQLNYAEIDRLLDIQSMIDFLIVQELVYNVELDAPRSMYLHKDIEGKWTMGPLWDFDGGFNFNWNNMTSSHTYFESYQNLVMGTSPSAYTGTSYRMPGFFADLFRIPEFVNAFKSRWKKANALIPAAWEKSITFYNANTGAWQHEEELWPIGKDHKAEIRKMEAWINNRAVYLGNVIAAYPD